MEHVPLLVKHMTVAILNKGSLKGDRVEQFQQAFEIARSQCVKYNLIGAEGGDDIGRIVLTNRGTEKESAHRREADGPTKTRLFDTLYALWEHRKKKPEDPAAVPSLPTPRKVEDKLRDLEARLPKGREW